MDTRIHNACMDKWISEFLDVQCAYNTRILNYYRYQDTSIHGYINIRIPGYMDTWLHRYCYIDLWVELFKTDPWVGLDRTDLWVRLDRRISG